MKLINKSGKLTKPGKDFLVHLVSESAPLGRSSYSRFHGVHTCGRGRFVTISYSDRDNALELFTLLKIDFTEGNDAPRGGKCGQYFEYDRGDLMRALLFFLEA